MGSALSSCEGTLVTLTATVAERVAAETKWTHVSDRAEKEVDIVKEILTVPSHLTKGIDVKVAIYMRMVATLSLDWHVCMCPCSNQREAETNPVSPTSDTTADTRSGGDCSDRLHVGPAVQIHILGTGSASVGVRILTIRGTMNLQVERSFLWTTSSLEVSSRHDDVQETEALIHGRRELLQHAFLEHVA